MEDGLLCVNFTDWKTLNTNYHEYFEFGKNVWDIEKAKEILKSKPRKSYPLKVADWKGIADLVTLRSTKIDYNVPIICAKFGKGFFPIDGWHRIIQALKENVEVLPSVRLTSLEVKIIKNGLR